MAEGFQTGKNCITSLEFWSENAVSISTFAKNIMRTFMNTSAQDFHFVFHSNEVTAGSSESIISHHELGFQVVIRGEIEQTTEQNEKIPLLLQNEI